MKAIQVVGYRRADDRRDHHRDQLHRQPGQAYNDLCDLMPLAARGSVNLHTQKCGLDDFQSAITDLDNGNVRGRAILVP